MVGADGVENIPHREWLVVFDRVVNGVKAELEKQGRQDEFVGAKVIKNPLMCSLSFPELRMRRSSTRLFDSLLQRSLNGM